MIDINKKEKSPIVETPTQVQENPPAPEAGTEQTPSTTIPEGAPMPEQPAEMPEQNIEQVKEQIAEVEDASSQSRPPQVSPIMKDQAIMQDLKDVMALDKPKQIKVLVYLAFKKGIHHAASIAKKLKDPYLMDEFHDTLVSELYNLLIQKRKIKKK